MQKNDTLRNLLFASAIFMTVYFVGSSLLSRIVPLPPPPPQGAGAPPAGAEAPPGTSPQEQTATVPSVERPATTPIAVSPEGGLRAEEAQNEETILIGAAEGTE